MSDFYLSLPSHSSKTEYPSNSSNSFKIRLPHPIRLDGLGWKVGLASISLPDPTSQLPPLLKDQNTLLFRSHWLSSNSKLINRNNEKFSASFEPKDLRSEELSTLTGKGFMNTVKTFFAKKIIGKVLQPGWKLSDDDGKNRRYIRMAWEGDDMVIGNTNTLLTRHFGEYYPTFYINAEFAVEMGWFKDLGNNKYALGPNLSIELTKGTIPTPIDTTNAATPGDEYWAYEDPPGMIRLSMTCNWRFINLDGSFKNVLGSTKRSLFVYSDAGGSGVVGNQVTDLLREVNYNREGKGQQYFEPLHIQYIPVRKEVVDIIETEVAETTGELVQFGAGNTIVTLHFKKT